MPASPRKQAEVAMRRARVLELRAQGMTFQAIADEMGLASAGVAVTDATRALEGTKAVSDRQAGLLAALEAERIDAIERRVQRLADAARDDGDRDLELKCADRLMRLSARRSRLTGLDAVRRPAVPEARGPDGIDQLAARRAARRRGAG